MWACCFGQEGFRFVPWLALVPVFFLLGGRRAAWLVWIHGTVFWLAGLYWIPATMVTFGGVPWPLALLGLWLLASFLSLLFWLPFGLLGPRLWAAGGVATLVGLPALWVALEWLREFLFSGFPWNVAAYAAIEVPGALPATAWIGAYGLSFLLVAVNAAVALGIRQRRSTAPLVMGGLTALVLLAGWATAPAPEVAGDGAQPMRVLQPNIPNMVRFERQTAERNYYQMLGMADAACSDGALLVLPESGLWPYEYARHPFLVEDLDRIAERGCPLLVNSITPQGPGEPYFNSVLLVADDGVAGRYDKRQLVPFGEYVPFRGILPAFDKLARAAGDFTSGSEPSLIDWGGHRLGLAVCYEVIYPTIVAEQVRAGATALVTVTNDGWYGDTWAPWQHLRGARFRAAESRRPLLRAAITGVSAVIAPDGSVVGQLGVDDEGVLEAEVAPRTGLTLHSRAPWLVPGICTLLALAMWFARGRDMAG